ncbi:MAG: Ezrin/radixin/moesin family protein [Cytophagales bacterium]|nr:Ezrin/radixin/moesin family protein [Cytophaga sp.]
MKKILFPIALIAALAISSYAQMSKAEEKEWHQKIKTLTPASYKQLIEEKETLSNQVNKLNAEAYDAQTKLSAQEAQIAGLQKQLAEANAEKEAAVAAGPAGSTKGVVYKVQIGAFKNKDLSKYFENNKNFSGEVDADGTKKYTLGSFASYYEAENFKKYLRQMGVSDAWVVAYKDGARVEIKDALEGTL